MEHSTYLDDTLDVSMSLGVIQRTQLGGSLTFVGVGHKHGPSSLTLCTNNTTHFLSL